MSNVNLTVVFLLCLMIICTIGPVDNNADSQVVITDKSMNFDLFENTTVINNGKGEKRIKIGVIDTGYPKDEQYTKFLCKNGLVSYVNSDGYDQIGHGSNIVSIITKDLDSTRFCIISYKIFSSKYKSVDFLNYYQAMNQAHLDGVTFLNMSLSGKGKDSVDTEVILLTRLIESGTKIFVAAGNDNADLNKRCDVYPACYRKGVRFQKNFFVIGGSNVYKSNYGDIVDSREDGADIGTPSMSGTSQATATATHKAAMAIQNNGTIK